MHFIEILKGAILAVLIIVGAGYAAGLFMAVKNFYANLFLNTFNKRHGRAYFIISGDPAVVEVVHQVVVGTVERVEAEQRAAQAERIKLNDQEVQPKEEGPTQ